MLQMLQNRAKFDPDFFLGCPFHEMHKKTHFWFGGRAGTPPFLWGFKKKKPFFIALFLLKKTLFFCIKKQENAGYA